MDARVEACIVNHNTSEFAELALRTLVLTHEERLASGQLRITVVDNHSTDAGLTELRAACSETGTVFERSRWPASEAVVNSHGDVLRDFLLAKPDATHLCFVDADIFFLSDDCVGVMLDELAENPDLWAVQARYHWVEASHGSGASLNVWAGRRQALYIGVDGTTLERPFHGQCKPRCHPGCTLIANTPTFRRVADTVGLSAAIVIGVDETTAGFADTLGLASLTMATHGLRYRLSESTVGHYHCVSYEDQANTGKLHECRRRLAALRTGARFEPGPWG